MANVFGTWDFKWPQGTKIRIAFQELTEPDAKEMPSLRELIGTYEDIATRWLQGGANIGFDFLDTTLPAPVEAQQGIFNLRSPAGWTEIPYDVLVSFASTPAVIAGVAPITEITGQVSVLGSYARRINYGTPTTLVGPNRKFIPTGKKLYDYFKDPIFSEIVLHELGHVLGIPHQHQNPLYSGRPDVKNDSDVNLALNGIRTKYWTQFSPEIEQEIRRPWPSQPKQGSDVPFSDWEPFTQGNQRLENESVMAHPIWSDLTTLASYPSLQPLNAPHQTPTSFDLALLAAMYLPV
ncbi:MAG TPA: hypothetical protein VER11_17315 [Polyangiaceae bacterium]|nr:hypothetical protein [Polyangiaceae bacterium]